MSCVVSARYGNYNGNSPFTASFKLDLDFLQYILIMVYCKEIFSILSYEKIIRTIHHSATTLLIIGYIEFLIYVGAGGLLSIYNPIARTFHFSEILPSQAISLTVLEPSHAAMLLGVFLVPFYLSQIIYDKNNSKSYLIELILWSPIIIITKSTSTYFIVFTCISVALIMTIFSRKTSGIVRFISVCSIVLFSIIILYPETVDKVTGFNFSYLLTDKAFDLTNQSTASRRVPLSVDLNIFKKYPIFGCGNGLQGYFYNECAPQWVNQVYLDKPVRTALRGMSPSIPNGTLFFPAIISGYGIFGSGLFLFFFYKCYARMINNREEYKSLYYYYMIAFIPMVLSGFKSEFIGIYYIWFVLSIPMIAIKKEKEERNVR